MEFLASHNSSRYYVVVYLLRLLQWADTDCGYSVEAVAGANPSLAITFYPKGGGGEGIWSSHKLCYFCAPALVGLK